MDKFATQKICHENKDRYIASRCLEELFRPYTITISGTSLYSPVDLTCTVDAGDKVGKFNIEVKSRKKDAEKLKKYPNCELKVDKLDRILQATPEDTVGLYMVLLNDNTCIVYNLKVIDWSKVETFNWRLLETQVNPDSTYKNYLTYSIPISLAVAKLDITGYIQDYYKSLQVA